VGSDRLERRPQECARELGQRNLSCAHDEVQVTDLAIARHIVRDFQPIWRISHHHRCRLTAHQPGDYGRVAGVADQEPVFSNVPQVANAAHRNTASGGKVDPVLAAGLFGLVEVDKPVDLEGIKPGQLDLVAELNQT